MLYLLGTLFWMAFGIMLGLGSVIAFFEWIPMGLFLFVLTLCVFKHMRTRSNRHRLEISEKKIQKSTYDQMMDDFDLQEKCVLYEGILKMIYGSDKD